MTSERIAASKRCAPRTHELLDAAPTQGVRYFDAARSSGRSEEFLADSLKSRPDVDDVVIGSKWATPTPRTGPRTPSSTRSRTTPSPRTSDSARPPLLGDRLDLYQIHSVTPDSPALTDKELHAKLAEAAAQGLSIGFSTSGPAQADAIRAALAVTVDGEPLFRTVQSTYNVLETSAAPPSPRRTDAGLTVMVKEGMANGRLAGEHAPDAVRAIAEETGLGADTVALALILRQPWAGVVLSGTALPPARLEPARGGRRSGRGPADPASRRSRRTRTCTGSGAGSCPGTDRSGHPGQHESQEQGTREARRAS